jgi:hypothetical protein
VNERRKQDIQDHIAHGTDEELLCDEIDLQACRYTLPVSTIHRRCTRERNKDKENTETKEERRENKIKVQENAREHTMLEKRQQLSVGQLKIIPTREKKRRKQVSTIGGGEQA